MTPDTLSTLTSGVMRPPPLTLYVHLPWCVRKCPYCDFNSHRAAKTLPEEEYVDALLADAEKTLPSVWGRRPCAIYFGGGTPSLFSPTSIFRLLSGLRALYNPLADAEITLEANPGAADAGKFAEFRAMGINRLSLGAQSFNDEALSRLGRIHDGAQSHAAAAAACDIFDNVNLDLMHALPEQTQSAALSDVNMAMGYRPTHLSLYELTLEAETVFYKSPPAGLPSSDETAAISEAVIGVATGGGYARYEVSAYALKNHECRHNLNYWRFGDYLGIGAGAHAKISINGALYREQRVKHPADYMKQAMKGDAVSERRKVSGREAVFEFMLNTLRLCDGFEISLLAERLGGGTSAAEKALTLAEEQGLIARSATTICPTGKGLRYLNDLLLLFLPEKAEVISPLMAMD